MAKIHRPWAEVVKEKAPGNMSLDTMDTVPCMDTGHSWFDNAFSHPPSLLSLYPSLPSLPPLLFSLLAPLEAARHVLGVLGCAGSSQTREGGGGSLPNAGTSIDITPDDVL